MFKVILTTGGTGGHIYPAIATGEALSEFVPDVSLLFMGATYGPEKEMARAANIPFAGLPGRGILGRGWRALPAAFENIKAVCMAIKLVRAFRPCVVAAFGGYACFAPALAAKLLHIPLLLHEQNAICGTSIKLLASLAQTICVSLPQTRGIKKPVVVTGNPVRKGIRQTSHSNKISGRHLLILGGSQGAHALNKAIVQCLPSLSSANIEILHQTGTKDLEWVRKAYLAAGYSPQCAQPFIENMPSAYQWADLAVCRAGASTVAELCIAEVPSILVPFPAAIHDHQTLNAQVLVDAGAAILLRENNLDKLLPSIISLMDHPEALGQMSRACVSLGRPDAASLVAREIVKLCDTNNVTV